MKSYWAGKAFFLIFLMLFINCCSNTLVQTPQQDIQLPIVQKSVVQRVSFVEGENYTRIHMEGSETLSQPFFKVVPDPLKVIVDIPNIDVRQIKEPLRINNGTIGEVSAMQHDDKGRIEIGLDQMANYNVSKGDKDLIIDIEKVKSVSENQEAKQEIKKEEKEEKVEESAPPSVITEKDEPLFVPQAAPAAPPENVAKAKEVIDLLLEEKNDSITFNIIADGRLGNYNGFKLDSPSRFVLDIWDMKSRYPKKSIKIKNPLIKEVRIGQHADKLRLVFDPLKPQLPPYQVNQIDNRIIVSFGNVPGPAGPQILVQGKSTEGMAPAKTAKPGSLKEINFKQMDGKSRIFIVFSEEPQFESRMISHKVIAVDIRNASVPKRLQRRLDTSEFESAVDTIDLENVKTGKTSDVRVLIRLREETPFETIREGKTLFIDIEKPKKIEAEMAPVPEKEMRKEEVKAEAEVKDEVKIETRAETRTEAKPEPKPEPKVEAKAQLKTEPKPEAMAEEKKEQERTSPELKKITEIKPAKKAEEEKKISEEGAPEKIYSGRKLSLDFKDADIKNILRLIAEVSDLNIITSDDVSGKITMRLVDVPWDQALEIILQAKALGMTRIGNVVRVAPLEALKKEIQAELEAKRSKEKLEDLVLDLIPVNYATGKEIIPQIKGVLSDRGDIRVDERTNTLIVKDIPRNIASMKSLVKSLDTKTPQVLIEARIVEANLTFQKELGVKWGFQVGGGRATVGGGNPSTTLATPTTEVVDLPAVARGAVPGATGTAGLIEFLFSRGSIRQLDVAISAHENKGDVKIISSPKIATLDNKEASVEQGLRIPYRKLTTEGTVTTDFIDANLKLTVTPHVTNDGTIKLSIKAKKDAPDQSITVDGVPSIDKKEAITEVLVKDNGVVVIAGVYSIEKNEGNEGIPLFNKIPLLGWLFKREVKEDKRRDLLIFISPKIIKDEI